MKNLWKEKAGHLPDLESGKLDPLTAAELDAAATSIYMQIADEAMLKTQVLVMSVDGTQTNQVASQAKSLLISTAAAKRAGIGMDPVCEREVTYRWCIRLIIGHCEEVIARLRKVMEDADAAANRTGPGPAPAHDSGVPGVQPADGQAVPGN